MADHETIEIPAGESHTIDLNDGDVLSNVIYDVRAEHADLHIQAFADNWGIRNVGIRGSFDIGSGEGDGPSGFDNVIRCRGNGVIDTVYAGDGVDHGIDKTLINVDNDHTGHIDCSRLNVSKWSSNAIYAAGFGRVTGPGPTDGGGGTIGFDHCYLSNNNVAHLRLAADGTTVRDTVIHNTNNVPASPETAGGLTDIVNSRGIYTGYGDPSQIIRVENCDIDVTEENTCGPDSPDYYNQCAASAAVSGTHGTYGDLSTIRIVDSEVRGDLIGEHVETENVGNNPDTTIPDSVPTTPEEAASGDVVDDGFESVGLWLTVDENVDVHIEVNGQVEKGRKTEPEDEIRELDNGNMLIISSGMGFGTDPNDYFRIRGTVVDISVPDWGL